MYRLYKVEMYKLLSKKSIPYLFILLIISVYLFTYFNRNKEHEMYDLIETLEKDELEEYDYNIDYSHYLNQVTSFNKKVTNEIEVKELKFFEKNFLMTPFITLIFSIISVTFVSCEYEGTIKILVSKPFKRWKFVLSKTFALLTLVLSAFLIFYTFSIFSVNIIHDTYLLGIKTAKQSVLIYTLKKTFLCFVPSVFSVSLGIMISILFKTNGISIGLTSIVIVFSGLIANIFYGFDIKVIEYLFFPYVELSSYNNLKDIFETNLLFDLNLSTEKGVLILLLYSFIFISIATRAFCQKDIEE